MTSTSILIISDISKTENKTTKDKQTVARETLVKKGLENHALRAQPTN